MRKSLRSTSTRTFVLLPAVALAESAARRRPLQPGWLPVLAVGYGLYRAGGQYRRTHGGGGPGMSVPPKRLVMTGPYAVTRNPMYLGHLVYAVGVAGLTRSAAGLVAALAMPAWFDRRVRSDEDRLRTQFGAAYDAYCGAVPRWLPVPALPKCLRVDHDWSGH